MKTRRRLAGFETWEAQNAFLGFASRPVVERLLIRTSRNAGAPSAATLLVDQNDAVFSTLVQRSGWTGRHARRVEAVIADPGKIKEHQPFGGEELFPLLRT